VPQVDIESKTCKQFIIIQFQALTPGAFNTVTTGFDLQQGAFNTVLIGFNLQQGAFKTVLTGFNLHHTTLITSSKSTSPVSRYQAGGSLITGISLSV